jgi:hypothetical protein
MSPIPLLLALISFGAEDGNPATERYIPIGQSPGLSGEATYIGLIRRVDEESYTMTVEDDAGNRRQVRVTPDSEIWVDRSKRRRTSLEGSLDDCRPGRRVEILLRGQSKEADWVKVEGR